MEEKNMIHRQIREFIDRYLDEYDGDVHKFIQELEDNDDLTKEMLEEFEGQEVFYANLQDVIDEIEEEQEEEREAERLDKLQEIVERDGVMAGLEFYGKIKNDIWPFMKDVNCDYYTGVYLPAEVVEKIDDELLKNDKLVSDVLESIIIPDELIEKYDNNLDYVYEDAELEFYEYYRGNWNMPDMTKHYASFVERLSPEQIEKNISLIAEKIPDRLFQMQGLDKKEKLEPQDLAIYPDKFKIEKLAEREQLEEFQEYIKQDNLSAIRKVAKLFDRGYGKNRRDIAEKLVEIVENYDIEVYGLLCIDGVYDDEIIKSYMRKEGEIPEDIIDSCSDEELARLQKEIELEKLQEEDARLDVDIEKAEQRDNLQQNNQDNPNNEQK